MSVIIEDMEIPEYCYDCPCHNPENGVCMVYKKGYLSCIERPAVCPLKEQKEADANVVINKIHPFVIIECGLCKHSGIYGAITPKYCPECGAKLRYPDKEDKP